MKYEYQDVIIKELIRQKEDEIDKSSFKNATLNVFNYQFGHYEANPEYNLQKDNPDIHIHIAKGSVLGVCDTQGAEYCIDFTVYEIDNPAGSENHVFCFLNIM